MVFLSSTVFFVLIGLSVLRSFRRVTIRRYLVGRRTYRRGRQYDPRLLSKSIFYMFPRRRTRRSTQLPGRLVNIVTHSTLAIREGACRRPRRLGRKRARTRSNRRANSCRRSFFNKAIRRPCYRTRRCRSSAVRRTTIRLLTGRTIRRRRSSGSNCSAGMRGDVRGQTRRRPWGRKGRRRIRPQGRNARGRGAIRQRRQGIRQDARASFRRKGRCSQGNAGSRGGVGLLLREGVPTYVVSRRSTTRRARCPQPNRGRANLISMLTKDCVSSRNATRNRRCRPGRNSLGRARGRGRPPLSNM